MFRRLTIPGWITVVTAIAITPIAIGLLLSIKPFSKGATPPTAESPSFRVVPLTSPTSPVIVSTGGEEANFSTAEPAPALTCTYHRVYWRDHPDRWLTENIIIGDISFDKNSILVILNDESGEMPKLLLREFFTAILNTVHGADPQVIEQDLQETGTWLRTNLSKAVYSETELETGLALVHALENYNLGLTGPGACPDQPGTPLPPATVTGTATITPAPTRRYYSPPLPATQTPVVPSATPISTLLPTEQPPTANPTSTIPVITDTPFIPPTNTPEPTNTPVPSKTPKPTKTPKVKDSITETPATESASTCDILTGSISVNDDQKYMWFRVTNNSSAQVRIEEIQAVWPVATNGVLKEILFAGDQIFISDIALSPALIPSVYPWKESALDSYRDLPAGATKTLEFRYQEGADSWGYWTQLIFDNGCSVTAP